MARPPTPQKYGLRCPHRDRSSWGCTDEAVVQGYGSPFPSLAQVLVGRQERAPAPDFLLSEPRPRPSQGEKLWWVEKVSGRKRWAPVRGPETCTLLPSVPPSSSARLPTGDGSSGGRRGAGEQAQVWEGADRDLQGGEVSGGGGGGGGSGRSWAGPMAKASLRGARWWWRGWWAHGRHGCAPPPQAGRREGPGGAREAVAGRRLWDAGLGGLGGGRGGPGPGQPRDGGASRQRGNLDRGREGGGRVRMRSRRKRRWMKMRRDLQREAEEAVVGGRKG